MSIHLYIDDERTLPPQFNVLATTPTQALYILQEAKAEGRDVATISFDHDMGAEIVDRRVVELTTRPVVEWMVENEFWPPQLFFHSANPAGAKWLYDKCQDHAPSSTSLEIVNERVYWS